MAPTVSVVIPTYFTDLDILGRSIRSALRQTLDDIEVVVVNDSPSRPVEPVLESFRDDRLRLVTHSKNNGGSAARNTGAVNSSGRFIGFLDADDTWVPSKLDRQLNYIRSHPHRLVGCYCDTDPIRHGVSAPVRRFITSTGLIPIRGNDESPTIPSEGGTELVPPLLRLQVSTGGASTLLVRRDAFEAIDGFDESFPRHQDIEFMVRLARHGRIGYVDERLVKKYESSMPRPETVRRAKERFFTAFSDEISRLGTEEIRRYHRYDLAKSYLRYGYPIAGLREFRRSHREIPNALLPIIWFGSLGVYDRARRRL